MKSRSNHLFYTIIGSFEYMFWDKNYCLSVIMPNAQ